MAFKNQNVSPVQLSGTPAVGDNKADANMPANNHGTFPVKLGVGQTSKFGKSVSKGAAQQAAAQKSGPKVKMPAHNNGQKPLPLGTTKHAVGTVPHYLRGQ